MPTFVRVDKCDGCRDLDRPLCVHLCPHDLMRLDQDGSHTGHVRKAFNREPAQCWECYACVKACPQNAIECRAYADFVPLGGSVQPLSGDTSIIWTIRFRNGNKKRFKYPTRTIPAGSVEPYSGEPKAWLPDLIDDGSLFTGRAQAGDRSQFRAE